MKVPNPRKLKSGTWFIQLRLNGESVPVSAATKKECIDQARLIKAEHKAGVRVVKKENEQPKSPTLSKAIDAYIAKRDAVLSPATIRGYRNIQRSRFQDTMGRRLADIKSGEWQGICNRESKLCQPKTLKNAWGFIASVVYEETGDKPPKVKLPQIVSNDRPFLEPEQIRPFIEAVHGTNVEIEALLALSSLRRSEILALTWDHIDLEKKIIRVSGAAVPNENNRLEFKEANKNATSNRVVPIMISELETALRAAQMPAGRVVAGNGEVARRRINRICKANGFPQVGIHGLRHSFVSLAYHLGVPEKVVMEIGGWADYQTMRNIYTHIARSDVTKYAGQFSEFFHNKERVIQNANRNANHP